MKMRKDHDKKPYNYDKEVSKKEEADHYQTRAIFFKWRAREILMPYLRWLLGAEIGLSSEKSSYTRPKLTAKLMG